MSTEAAQQVLDGAFDAHGVSVVSATKTVEEPRKGSIYNPSTLAAGLPVWFHHLQDGRYLALLAERWHSATVADGEVGGPQSYQAYVTTTTPSWVSFHPATGVTGAVTDIPSGYSGVRDLSDASSRGDYLFTVGTCDDVPHIAHHRFDDQHRSILQGEELLPLQGESEVAFSHGCQIRDSHLFLFGMDTDGDIYMARKRWGRIGVNNDADPAGRWEFRHERGWSSDPDDLAPILDHRGDPLNSDRPVSSAWFRDRWYLATNDGAGEVSFWMSRPLDSVWSPFGEGVSGCDNLYLQPQLYYNSENLPEGYRAAIPYVRTDYVDTADAESLTVAWGSLGV